MCPPASYFRSRLIAVSLACLSAITPKTAWTQRTTYQVCQAPPDNVYTSSAGMKILADGAWLKQLASKIGLSVERRAELIHKELPGVYDFQVLEHLFCTMEQTGRINHDQYLELISKVLPTIQGARPPVLTPSAPRPPSQFVGRLQGTTDPAPTRVDTAVVQTSASGTTTPAVTALEYDEATASARVRIADKLWSRHLVPAAIDTLRQLVQAAPTYATARNQLAWYLAMIDRPQEALPHGIKAFELSGGKDPEIDDTVGYIYASMGDFSRAAFYYQSAVDVTAPGDKKARYARKLTEVRGQLVPDEPERAFWWWTQGQRHFYSGDLTGAVNFYKRAVATPSKYWQALNSLAWTLAMLGDANAAFPYIKECFESGGSDDANVNDTVAYIYASLGDFAKAEQFYAKAIELAPTAEQADAFRVKLASVKSQQVPIEPEARW